MLERYHITFRRAGAGARWRGQAAARRDHRTARGARHRVQPERARRRAGLHACRSKSEAELAGLPDFMREAMKSRSAGTRPRWLCGDAVALQRRAVPAILRPPRSARKSLSRLRHAAATMAARPTTRRSSPRWCGCAPSARGLLGYADFAHYRLDDAMAKTPEAVRDLLDTVWAPARAAGARRSRRHAGAHPGGRRQFQTWRRGTGAITPKSCGSGAAISTKPRSSRISISTA